MPDTHTRTQHTPGPMYDWVARHVSEVEHEVIEFHGSTLDLLRAAREQDAIRADLLAALEVAVGYMEDLHAIEDYDKMPIATALIGARAAIRKARGEDA